MKNNVRLTISAVLLLPILFASCGNRGEASAPLENGKKAVPVRTAQLIPRDFTEYGEYYGTLEPSAEAVLTVPAGGTVEAISVQVGEFVEENTSLGSVELESALASLRVAELNEQISRETYQRQNELLQRGNAAKLAVDQAELAWKTAQVNLISAREMYAGAECRTPLTGTVLSRHMELYDELSQGAASFTVADTSSMRVEIGIPESEIAGIAPGNSAEIFLDIYPGESWQGTLSSLDRQVSSVSLTFTGEVEIDNSKGILSPGLTAKIRLVRRVLKDSIVVPSGAVLNDGTESYIMLAEGDTARRITVIPGASDGDNTVINFTTGSPEPASEEIIIEGNHLVRDGGSIERIPLKG